MQELIFRYQGNEVQCVGGQLSLMLKTEGWDPSAQAWVYGQDVHLLASLQIVVDEDSGEDGAASPDASWRFAPNQGLFVGIWDDSAPEMEAWFGNDAPMLENNRLELLGLNAQGLVRVRWTATLEHSGDPLEMEGVVQFKGLTCTTTQPLDAPRLLGELWPGSKDWSFVTSEPVDYGPNWPSHRRFWSTLSWKIPTQDVEGSTIKA